MFATSIAPRWLRVPPLRRLWRCLHLPAGFPADADGSDHFSVDGDGNSALQRRRAGQRQCGNAAFLNLILEILAGTAEDRRGPRLADAHFDAGDLRVIQPL